MATDDELRQLTIEQLEEFSEAAIRREREAEIAYIMLKTAIFQKIRLARCRLCPCLNFKHWMMSSRLLGLSVKQ